MSAHIKSGLDQKDKLYLTPRVKYTHSFPTFISFLWTSAGQEKLKILWTPRSVPRHTKPSIPKGTIRPLCVGAINQTSKEQTPHNLCNKFKSNQVLERAKKMYRLSHLWDSSSCPERSKREPGVISRTAWQRSIIQTEGLCQIPPFPEPKQWCLPCFYGQPLQR